MVLLLFNEQISEHLALHDELTGLANPGLFENRFSNARDRAVRLGSPVALLVIDLNKFKQVNDTLGHLIGDLVLKEAAKRLSSRLRRSDTVARTGGNEFSVILDSPIDRDNAEKVARDLASTLNEALDLADHHVELSASIGISMFPEDGRELQVLLGLWWSDLMFDLRFCLERLCVAPLEIDRWSEVDICVQALMEDVWQDCWTPDMESALIDARAGRMFGGRINDCARG